MRTPEELQRSGLAVLDLAFKTPAIYRSRRAVRHRFPRVMAPLYSGGHDSLCACHVASRHPRWGGEVYHIDTGIGAKATREHVDAASAELGWRLRVLRSPQTYEQFISYHGFPGPGSHRWTYIRLKERCVDMIAKGRRVVLVTGARAEESTRRMGHVEAIRVGETKLVDGVPTPYKLNRTWANPCHDWGGAEQQAYMAEHDLPRNPLKDRLGMSGECFCGAFAAPNELEAIRRHAPDVAAEIDRLAAVARECGKHAVWGTRPPGRGKKGLAVVETGPLCVGCDRKADAAGVMFAPLASETPTPPPK